MDPSVATPPEGCYVARPVLNVEQLRSWALAQGLPPLDANLHLTVLYTKGECPPWRDDPDSATAEVLGMAVLGPDKAVVLMVDCPECDVSHWYAREQLGVESNYAGYKPHVTLYYNGPMPAEPPDFLIELGPEQHGPPGQKLAFVTKAYVDTAEVAELPERATLAQKAVGYNPNRAADGRFTSGTGQGTGANYVKGQWKTAKGAKVPARVAARMKELAIPPGWKDVRLNPDPKGSLQAVGVDGKGRTVRKYSTEFTEGRAAAKFERLKAFNKVLPKLRTAMSKDLNGHAGPAQEAAAALRLIDRTGFRVGSDRDTLASVQAYGATTLKAEHLTIKGDQLQFTFVGKKGVTIEHTLRDAELASFLKPRKAAGGRLFNTTDMALRRYIKTHGGARFMPKDFRTHNATHLALKLVSKMGPVSGEAGFKKARMAVAKQVSRHLGNTPAMALKAYIDPAVWTRIRRRPRAA